MNKNTANPLVALANKCAIEAAAEQLRFAQYFTPYGFEPERVDYERVRPLLDRPIETTFPQVTENFRQRLKACQASFQTLTQNLTALKDAGVEPDIDPDTLYQEARDRVVNIYATPMRVAG